MSERLGQHFLKNKSAIEKIVTVLKLEKGDNVVEIGPGHGELTLELLKNPIELTVMEKDTNLVQELKNKNLNIKILEGDALKFLKNWSLDVGSWKLVGNIPYYITGHLLRIISELENKPLITVLTIQKEVAERIISQPPKMNRLSAITQFWSEPKIVATLHPNDFDPSPEVESAIIELRTKNYEKDIMINYYKMVRILFQQPRKTILNNLSFTLSLPKEEIAKKLEFLNIKAQNRPQDLSIDFLVTISKIYRL